MTTKQQILNMALMKIGDIKLADDDLSNRPYLNIAYATGKDIMLSYHYWNFAKIATDLMLVSESGEIPNYKYKYLVPIDMVSLVKLFSTYLNNVYDYTIIGKNIYSNEKNLKIMYISNTANDDDIYPPYFAEAFACYIAKEICTVVAGKANMLQVLSPLFQLSLSNAISKDSSEIPSPILKSNYYKNSRY
ncbi:MAG: hypothetical protein LW807_07170 [Proteobacteria bacterium]|jgi:hypothetical protein|nr:hypothetical protein [Pseudomonadota bacterium]